MLVTVLALMLGDLFLGIWASKKRGEAITSNGIRRTLTKLVVYELGLLFAFLAEHYLELPIPVCKLIAGMVAVTEMTSILENLNDISGGSFLKTIISTLHEKEAEIEKQDEKKQ
jgi:hypothetical protein